MKALLVLAVVAVLAAIALPSCAHSKPEPCHLVPVDGGYSLSCQ